MWRSKARLSPHHTTPLSHIHNNTLKTNETYLNAGCRPQFHFNHIILASSQINKTFHDNAPKWVFQHFLRSMSKKIRIHNWKNLKTFSLEPSTIFRLNDEDLKYLGRTITRHFNTAQEISLVLDEAILTQKGIANLLSSICRDLADLRSLKIYLTSLSKLNDKGMRLLAESIVKYHPRGLRQVSFGFLQQFFVSPLLGNLALYDLGTQLKSVNASDHGLGSPIRWSYGIKELSNQITRKPLGNTLESLDFTFTQAYGGFNNATVSQIMSNICQRLPNLKHLKISLGTWNPSDFTSPGLCSILSNITQHLKNLQSLSLDFSNQYQNMNKKVAEHLSVCIEKSLRNLKSLELNLNDCKGLTNPGVNLVCSALSKNLQNLEKLALGLERCGFTEETFQFLFSDHQFHALRSLTVTLDCGFAREFGRSSDEEDGEEKRIIQAHSQVISGFKALKKLDLIFPSLNTITDKIVEALGSTIGEHQTELESLALVFATAYDLTDEGVSKLTSNFCPHLKKLKSLTLIFHDGIKLTDAGIQSLTKSISQNLTGLEEFRLEIFSRRVETIGITDEGLEYLGSRICQNLKNLRVLLVTLPEKCQITAKGILFFGAEIRKHAERLKCLALDFRVKEESGSNRLSFFNKKSDASSAPTKGDLIVEARKSLQRDLYFVPMLNIVCAIPLSVRYFSRLKQTVENKYY